MVPWLAFLLLGVWLGRRDLLDPAVRRRVLIGGAAVALAAAAAFYAGAVTFAALWTRRFERGPLEWVMRAVAG